MRVRFYHNVLENWVSHFNGLISPCFRTASKSQPAFLFSIHFAGLFASICLIDTKRGYIWCCAAMYFCSKLVWGRFKRVIYITKLSKKSNCQNSLKIEARKPAPRVRNPHRLAERRHITYTTRGQKRRREKNLFSFRCFRLLLCFSFHIYIEIWGVRGRCCC